MVKRSALHYRQDVWQNDSEEEKKWIKVWQRKGFFFCSSLYFDYIFSIRLFIGLKNVVNCDILRQKIPLVFEVDLWKRFYFYYLKTTLSWYHRYSITTKNLIQFSRVRMLNERQITLNKGDINKINELWVDILNAFFYVILKVLNWNWNVLRILCWFFLK